MSRHAFRLLCLVLALAVPVTNGSAAAPPVAVAFMLLVPGEAVVGHLPLPSFALELTIAVAVSVSIGTLSAMVLMGARQWHPVGLGLVLAGASAASLLVQLVRRNGRREVRACI